jgi:hypothetical protein
MDKDVKKAWRERKEIAVDGRVYVDRELILDRLAKRFEDEKESVRKEEETPNIEDIVMGIEICVQLLNGYY